MKAMLLCTKTKSVLIVVSCIIMFSLITGHASAEPYRHSQTGLTLPDRIDVLKLWMVRDYEKDHPGLGAGLSYRHDQQIIRVDVFIYDKKVPTIPDGAAGIVETELKNAIGDIYTLEKRGNYRNVSMITQKEIVPVGTGSFLHSLVTFFQNNAKWTSHIYITGYKKNFMKLRITYMSDSASEGERLTAAVLRVVGSALK